MFARDIHAQDIVTRYYPKYQLDNFEKDMFFPAKRLLHSIVLSPDEQQSLKTQAISASYMTIGSLVVSIATLFGYNRIPLIRRVQRRGRRIALKCLIVIIPYLSINMYLSYVNAKFLIDFYEKFKMSYKKYKEDGDVKLLNPNVLGKSFF